MGNYYIKNIWGPHAQVPNYPNDSVIHFAEGQESAFNRFLNCDGFLLYETGSRERDLEGSKAIYAWGVIASREPVSTDDCSTYRGKRFPYGARIELKKRVDPKFGVSLEKIREVIGRKNMQAKGGLISITEEQFETLRKGLTEK